MTPYRVALAAACLLFALAAAAEEGSVDLGAPADPARGSVAPPAALPEVDDEAARAAVQRAREEVVAARQRLDRASAAYSEMRTRDYPRGGARAAIVQERDAARRDYLRASAHYTEILEQSQQGE